MRGPSFGSLWMPLIAVAALLSALVSLRPPLEVLWGDEGTYVAMTASLVRDGDLVFAEPDRQWAAERQPEAGATVILQRTGAGLTYSKPVVQALLGAPFFALFGEVGLVLLNAVGAAAALVFGWLLLRRRGAGELSALTILTFFGCAALLPYVLWRVSDLLQFSLTLIGLVLAVSGLGRPGGSGRTWPLWAAALGGVALGLAAAMRLPNAALAAAAALACLLVGRPKRALAVGGAAALSFALAIGAGAVLTGTANPYKAARTSFNAETGYPVGPDADVALERFAVAPATQSVTWKPDADASRTAYSLLYFVVGRHSGLLLYFPMALLLCYRLLRHPDRIGLALAAGAIAIAAFYLIWMPWNYFGGSTFVGNRYFLTSYAALLVAAPGLPSGRQLVPVWLIAATVGISALYSVESSRELDPMSQSHAYAGIFRLLPYETTAVEIDGQRDRYWAGDFVRFIDPHAEVGDFSVTLDSERPPAEVVVATSWSGSGPTLLITSPSEPLELRVADWGRRRWHPLQSPGAGTRAVVELDPSPAWRRHRFWWSAPGPYEVRTQRWTLLTLDGARARATVRYLGDGSLLTREPALEVLSVTAEQTAVAGRFSRASVSVRNRSSWSWSSNDVLPVYLSYRLRGPDGLTVDGPRSPIEPPVEPGGLFARELAVAWPAAPGRYQLRIDLVIEHVAWFEDRLGRPLLSTTVDVK